MGNSDLKLVQTKSTISSLFPGSCAPNWLHGNANISKPIWARRQVNGFHLHHFHNKNLCSPGWQVTVSVLSLEMESTKFLCIERCTGNDIQPHTMFLVLLIQFIKLIVVRVCQPTSGKIFKKAPVRSEKNTGKILQTQVALFCLCSKKNPKMQNKPYHLEATLTIRRTFPLYKLRSTSFPLISCNKVTTKKLNEGGKVCRKNISSFFQFLDWT